MWGIRDRVPWSRRKRVNGVCPVIKQGDFSRHDTMNREKLFGVWGPDDRVNGTITEVDTATRSVVTVYASVGFGVAVGCSLCRSAAGARKVVERGLAVI